MSYFAKNLKYLRIQRGMEQIDLAQMLGRKSSSSVSEWEAGKYTPKAGVLMDIATIFGIPLSSLMDSDLSANEDTNKLLIRTTKSYSYLTSSISAGIPDNIDSLKKEDFETIEVPDILLGKYAGDPSIIITNVNGDSMNRCIPHGSFIGIKPVDISKLKTNDIVVFSDSGSFSIKRYTNDKKNERVIFRPDSFSDSFVDYVVPYETAENLKIWGKVVVSIVNYD
ncbi:LexA family transcriptional regulator [Listeria booriae]|uniref:LexA family transcriptional regulator n=1 Tax=Listeria booriae TaxID=1552123 RepID=A0A842CV29_9LIST|nr:LexA family transcriptional regulator [Listeria booriae]MBC2004679.1 LexA family transcriptional regulator [Listeria booriae]MBC2190496.1 LexA family transcriptional regulator [Listeria booriae]MBC6163338.1 LexA family transcriptional regulator [Listeria booriae]